MYQQQQVAGLTAPKGPSPTAISPYACPRTHRTKSVANFRFHGHVKRESAHYWDLHVTVLRAKNNHSHDYWSESDCYVTLRLPTASARTHRTKAVANSATPEWNETFHFRCHSHVKNILELNVYDEDSTTCDDLCYTVLFDISNLTPGQKVTKVFTTNAETKDELWIEFHITECPEAPGNCLSNGVLMAASFCTLDVKVEVDKLQAAGVKQNLTLKLKGAYKEDCVITNSEHTHNLMQTLRYYINRDLETDIGVTEDTAVAEATHGLSSLPLKPLYAQHEVKLSVPMGKNLVDLHLKTEECPENELQVRLDFDIPAEEKEFLEKRKVVVGKALQAALNLSSPPEPGKVPLVAVVASGGGTRAMTGLFGSLKGLQTLGLLDTVSYITGLSGSTWTLASLYDDPDWSKRDLVEAIAPVKESINKSMYSMFSREQLQYYREEMEQREKDGHLVSLVDMWGLAIEHLVYGKKESSTLSDQRRAVSEGQNPLPIYTAVNIRNGKEGNTTEAEWCEFTPYEVGIPKYGAFVPAEDFGSEFYLGHLIKKLPETRVPFLMGLWSSAFSLNLTQLWGFITGSKPSWIPFIGQDVSNTEFDDEPSTLDTFLINPVTGMANMLTNFLTNRPVISQMYNFLRGLQLHWNYNEHSNFTAWKDTHPDAFPNTLTPADSILGLVDAGFACNSGFPPVLGPHRRVDVIICLSYSWDKDQFMVVKKTQDHCTDHKIPFPRIDFSELEKEPLKEVYLFEDEENPRAPIVLHFPMVNVTFKEFKAPGVRREGDEELKEGEIDVSTPDSPYKTKNMTYTPEVFQRLVDFTSYNVLNNKETILQALRKALERDRPQEEVNDHEGDTCY